MNTIQLVVGDWSNDGHGMKDIVVINCNISHANLIKAFQAGSEKVGFNLTAQVCRDYEEDSLSQKVIAKLTKHKIFCDFEYLGPEEFAELWMSIAILGNRNIQYTVLTDETPQIHIGGYGLYH